MIRRLFWLTLGFVLGAWTVLRAQRLARQFGPRGMAHRAVGLGAAVREFAADVRSQMHLREAELRRAVDTGPNRTSYVHTPDHVTTDNVHTPHNTDKDGN
jgi:hypothetical protein